MAILLVIIILLDHKFNKYLGKNGSQFSMFYVRSEKPCQVRSLPEWKGNPRIDTYFACGFNYCKETNL